MSEWETTRRNAIVFFIEIRWYRKDIYKLFDRFLVLDSKKNFLSKILAA